MRREKVQRPKQIKAAAGLLPLAWRCRGFLCFCLVPPLFACSNPPPTTQPSTVSQRADEAIRDPFGYKPDTQFRDVSGGDLEHLDKDGLHKDLNDVFNP
jgi:hypothetical protein